MSIAGIGDIVVIRHRGDGVKWVIAGKDGSPRETRYARLVRLLPSGNWLAFTIDETAVDTVETPTFEIGQKVVNDGLSATVIAIEPDAIEGEARLRLQYDPHRKPLKGGGNFYYENSQTIVPAWKVSLQTNGDLK